MFELNNTNHNQSLTISANPTPTNILNSQVMPTVYQDLQRFATDPNVNEKLKLTFGSDYNVQTAQTILANWVIGNLSNIPSIELVERGDIAGANGAFASATNKIYLSKDILTGSIINTEAIKDVILEEIGHSIDAQVNTVDAPGDEGEIFAGVVKGKTFDAAELAKLKAEDDSGTIHLNGKEIQVEKASLPDPGLRTVAHIQDLGDRTFPEGAVAGTTGQSRRLEGFQINLDSPIPGLNMEYMAHVQDIGDTSWVREGQYVGTKGQSKRIEGFAIRLTGSQASKYDVFYQAHVEGIGNTPRVGNGQFSGTRGQSKRVEAISVWVQPKPQPSNPDIDIQLSYPKGGFSQPEMNQMEKAAQNWERIITKDKDSSGVLKISVVKSPTADSRWFADSYRDSARNYRTNFPGSDVDINGVDYQNNIRLNPSRFSKIVNDNSLVRLAMHEIGHTLGLDHETIVSLMNHDYFNAKMTDSMYNTLTAQGYSIDRNVPINWS
ncbi:MAG: matrixin family metalloprotease [Microcoleus sp.]